MSRYDAAETVDPAQAHVAAFQTWENMVRERGRIEQELAMSYVDLLTRYREKVAECEREKRNAIVWEREQRLSERELNGLKTAAVSLRLLLVAPFPCKGLGPSHPGSGPRVGMPKPRPANTTLRHGPERKLLGSMQCM